MPGQPLVDDEGGELVQVDLWHLCLLSVSPGEQLGVASLEVAWMCPPGWGLEVGVLVGSELGDLEGRQVVEVKVLFEVIMEEWRSVGSRSGEG